jgi:hypothetical protein
MSNTIGRWYHNDIVFVTTYLSLRYIHTYHTGSLPTFQILHTGFALCKLRVGFFAREQLKILLWRDGVEMAESVRFVIVRYVPFVHLFFRSLVRSLACSLVRSFTRSLVRSFACSFTRFVRLLVRLFARLLACSFACSLAQLLAR